MNDLMTCVINLIIEQTHTHMIKIHGFKKKLGRINKQTNSNSKHHIHIERYVMCLWGKKIYINPSM